MWPVCSKFGESSGFPGYNESSSSRERAVGLHAAVNIRRVPASGLAVVVAVRRIRAPELQFPLPQLLFAGVSISSGRADARRR